MEFYQFFKLEPNRIITGLMILTLTMGIRVGVNGQNTISPDRLIGTHVESYSSISDTWFFEDSTRLEYSSPQHITVELSPPISFYDLPGLTVRYSSSVPLPSDSISTTSVSDQFFFPYGQLYPYDSLITYTPVDPLVEINTVTKCQYENGRLIYYGYFNTLPDQTIDTLGIEVYFTYDANGKVTGRVLYDHGAFEDSIVIAYVDGRISDWKIFELSEITEEPVVVTQNSYSYDDQGRCTSLYSFRDYGWAAPAESMNYFFYSGSNATINSITYWEKIEGEYYELAETTISQITDRHVRIHVDAREYTVSPLVLYPWQSELETDYYHVNQIADSVICYTFDDFGTPIFQFRQNFQHDGEGRLLTNEVYYNEDHHYELQYAWENGDLIAYTNTITEPTAPNAYVLEYRYTYDDRGNRVLVELNSNHGLGNPIPSPWYRTYYYYAPYTVAGSGNPDLYLQAYPSPADNLFTVYVGSDTAGEKETTLRIHSANGELCYTKQASEDTSVTVDCSTWAAGVYVVSVFSGADSAEQLIVIK